METWVVLLLVEIAVLVSAAFGLRALWRRVKPHFGGAPGGWFGLAAVYAATDPPPRPIAVRASLVVGRVLWRNCVDVGVSPTGLHLAVRVPLFGASGKPPLCLPWSAFHDPEPAKLFWRAATLWHLGTPEVGTLTLLADLEARIRAAGGFPADASRR